MSDRPDLNEALRNARNGTPTFGNAFGGPPAHDSRFGLMDNALIRSAYEQGAAERKAQTSQAALGYGSSGFLRDVYTALVETRHPEYALFSVSTFVVVLFLLVSYPDYVLGALPVLVLGLVVCAAGYLRVRLLRYLGAFVASTAFGILAVHGDKVLEGTRRHALVIGLGVLAAAWVVHWRVYLRGRDRVLLPAAYAQSRGAALATRALLSAFVLGSVVAVVFYYNRPMYFIHRVFVRPF